MFSFILTTIDRYYMNLIILVWLIVYCRGSERGNKVGRGSVIRNKEKRMDLGSDGWLNGRYFTVLFRHLEYSRPTPL